MSPSTYDPSAGVVQRYGSEFLAFLRRSVYKAVIVAFITFLSWGYQVLHNVTNVRLLVFHAVVLAVLLAACVDYAHYRYIVEGRGGLRKYYPLTGRKGRQDSRQHRRAVLAIYHIIKNSSGDRIDLLVVSGYYYLGTPYRPGQLWNLLESRDRSFRILLLNPFAERFRRSDDAAHFPERWHLGRRLLHLNQEDQRETYLHNMFETIRALKDLRKRGCAISFGFYNRPPRWQLFIVRDRAAVQLVNQDSWAEYGPVLILRRRANLYTPFYHFRSAFEDMWREWQEEYRRNEVFYQEQRIGFQA